MVIFYRINFIFYYFYSEILKKFRFEYKWSNCILKWIKNISIEIMKILKIWMI